MLGNNLENIPHRSVFLALNPALVDKATGGFPLQVLSDVSRPVDPAV